MIRLAEGWDRIFPGAFCDAQMRQDDGNVWKMEFVSMSLNDRTIKAFLI